MCAELHSRCADDVWLIDLAATTEPAHVEETIVQALGVAAAGSSSLAAVIDHLRHRQALLLFDNCEHVISAVAAVIECLLTDCAQLRILATSRAMLNMGG